MDRSARRLGRGGRAQHALGELASLLVDHRGWLRLPRRPATRRRLAGVALLLAGVALVQLT
jgi:uncharacterized membrane protein YdcZ (DUF606 family)